MAEKWVVSTLAACHGADARRGSVLDYSRAGEPTVWRGDPESRLPRSGSAFVQNRRQRWTHSGRSARPREVRCRASGRTAARWRAQLMLAVHGTGRVYLQAGPGSLRLRASAASSALTLLP